MRNYRVIPFHCSYNTMYNCIEQGGKLTLHVKETLKLPGAGLEPAWF